MDISKLSISEIKITINRQENINDRLLEALAEDPRIGVRKLYDSIQRKKQAIENERKRLNSLWNYEKELWNEGYKMVAGLDEAGRGPLAGPVVASAVILKPNIMIYGLNDSKKLSPKKRGELEGFIKANALAYSIGIVSADIIDELNIYQASLKAMQIAVQKLKEKADYLLLDAVKLPEYHVPQKAITHGDSLSCSIAAASILAKEERDRIMIEFDKIYPQYGFAQHKGYGTKDHIEAIKKYGSCQIHRKSFAPVSAK